MSPQACKMPIGYATGNSDLAMDGAGVKSANMNQIHETPDKAIKV